MPLVYVYALDGLISSLIEVGCKGWSYEMDIINLPELTRFGIIFMPACKTSPYRLNGFIFNEK
jgi:hypothetical protein